MMWKLPGATGAGGEEGGGKRGGMLHGHDASNMLDEVLTSLPKPLARRLKYYRAFVATDVLRLEGVFAPTKLDGNKEELTARLWRGYVLGRRVRARTGEEEEEEVAGQPSTTTMGVSLRLTLTPPVAPPLPPGMKVFDAHAYQM